MNIIQHLVIMSRRMRSARSAYDDYGRAADNAGVLWNDFESARDFSSSLWGDYEASDALVTDAWGEYDSQNTIYNDLVSDMNAEYAKHEADTWNLANWSIQEAYDTGFFYGDDYKRAGELARMDDDILKVLGSTVGVDFSGIDFTGDTKSSFEGYWGREKEMGKIIMVRTS